MEPYIPYVWLAVVVIMAIAEGMTAQLVSIWFVVGGVAALIASVCSAPIWLQVVLFIGVTLLTLIVTRPVVKKVMRFQKTETNADRYIGSDGLVILEINNELGQGQVNVSGSIWTARTVDNAILPVGARVRVENIEGVKLMVRALEQ